MYWDYGTCWHLFRIEINKITLRRSQLIFFYSLNVSLGIHLTGILGTGIQPWEFFTRAPEVGWMWKERQLLSILWAILYRLRETEARLKFPPNPRKAIGNSWWAVVSVYSHSWRDWGAIITQGGEESQEAVQTDVLGSFMERTEGNHLMGSSRHL